MHRLAALAAIVIPLASAATPKDERGALHGTIRWWEGTEISWTEVVVSATWKRPQFPAFEEQTAWVPADADTFCGADGTITYRSHWYAPGERARPEELRDPGKREELRKRIVQRDREYVRHVRFDDDEVALCAAVSKDGSAVLGRLRIDGRTGRFVVEPPFFGPMNDVVPAEEVQTREVNALGEPVRPRRPAQPTLRLEGAWLVEKGTLSAGTRGGAGSWEEKDDPPPGEEGETRRVTWNLSPGVASPPSLELAGCAELAVGGGATLEAKATPTGGKYQWTADGTVVLSPRGGAAVLSCEEPGHATIRVSYEAPDGNTLAATKRATCVAVRGLDRAAPVEVARIEPSGKALPLNEVPFDVAPPDGTDVLEFPVADFSVASTSARPGVLLVDGLRDGATTIQPRTGCADVGRAIPITVVPCHAEAVARVRQDQLLARRRAETAARIIAESLSGEDFTQASDAIGDDVREAANALAELIVATAVHKGLAGEGVEEAADVAEAIHDASKAIDEALAGDTGVYGKTALKYSIDRLQKLVGLKKGVVGKWYKAGKAAWKLGGDLGALYGTSEVVNQAVEDAARANEEVVRLGEQLKNCRAKPAPGGSGGTKPSSGDGGGKQGGRSGGRGGATATAGGEPAAPPGGGAPQDAAGAPPEETPPEPPEPPTPPPGNLQAGVPIPCQCPERHVVTWTIEGRKQVIGTLTVGGTASCGEDLQESVKRFGGALDAIDAAGAAMAGIEEKDGGHQRLALGTAKAKLDQAAAGTRAFGIETSDLAGKLRKCGSGLAEVGPSLRKAGDAVTASAPKDGGAGLGGKVGRGR